MKWTGLNELREKYLEFFESKGHLRLPSFPLVPQGDKSILLINAGMTPMKKYFTGEETPPERELPPARNASVLPISREWASPPVTAHISRCWVTSHSVTISKRKLFLGRGNSVLKLWKWIPKESTAAYISKMTRPMISGQRMWA